MSVDFVHLHVHTHYSLLDGLTKTRELLKRCAEYDMPACAITDHGTVFGLLDFYLQSKDIGVKPILGCEVYVAPTNRFDKSAKSSKEASNHLLLLCENEQGYHNLCKLSTQAHLEGWHYKPRVDAELLEECHEGLIAATACLQGRVPRMLLEGKPEEAAKTLDQYIGIFGKENVCVEMMNHGMPEEEQVNPMLWDLAQKYKLPAIATNDSHYLERADAEAHDLLLCLQTKKTLLDVDRMRLPNDEFYLRTAEEMQGRFARWPEAVTNTRIIADRCNASIPTGLRLIPNYPVPEGYTKEDFLREKVYEGLKRRYGDLLPKEVVDRAEYELRVIFEMQFTDYFLVVWDLIHYARGADIPVGPGRGSGAGCLVAYGLQITNLDPLRYKLLFERFLNPERVSMPDFDVDFCMNRREELIEYSRSKYGTDCVSQIVTFGRMMAKNVVRNVARTLGMTVADGNRIATLIPGDLEMTLSKAIEKEPELKQLVEQDRQFGHLWRLALRLEGTINSYGKHAAGVVLCDHPLTDHIALFKPAGSEAAVTTQVEMKGVEKIGLLKMDILGLRTLTMISEAVRLIKKHHDVDLDMDNVPLDDEKTYALLRSGATTGVFQLESAGMRDLAKRIGLASMEEISALVALYRPGPMDLIDTYIQNKQNPETIQYDPPIIRPVLEETYGIAIYQEQVMQMVQLCAGFTLGKADIVRRAMGKKDKKLLDDQKKDFLKGCKDNKINAALAEDLWKRIETFAGYGFNKSHSMAYAFVAYQTAYLKAHYPVEFMSALLTSESGDLKKAAIYVDECRNLGIDVLPPDVNRSEPAFSVEGVNIRFGLGAVKNVGEGPCKTIVEDREQNGPYKDIFDFCVRMVGQTISARVIESLNKAGAFTGTGWNRRQVSEVTEQAISLAQIRQRELESGQISLFDLGGAEEMLDPSLDKPDLPEWPEDELLTFEKEMLGLYVTSHPLRNHEALIRRLNTIDLNDLAEKEEGEEGTIIGIITEAKKIYSRKGDAMAFITLETLQGPCDLTVFSQVYAEKKDLLYEDAIIACKVRINIRDNKHSLIVERVVPIDEAESVFAKAVHVRLKPNQQNSETVHKLALLLGNVPGKCDVFVHCLHPDHGEVIIHATSACMVSPSPQLHLWVEKLLGENAYFISAGDGLPTHLPAPAPREELPRWRRRIAQQDTQSEDY